MCSNRKRNAIWKIAKMCIWLSVISIMFLLCKLVSSVSDLQMEILLPHPNTHKQTDAEFPPIAFNCWEERENIKGKKQALFCMVFQQKNHQEKTNKKAPKCGKNKISLSKINRLNHLSSNILLW